MNKITQTDKAFYSFQNIRMVFIDGNANDTLQKCYITLQQQLSIPDYFGHNLDALEEVLADLEWVDEETIQIIIANKSALLSAELTRKEDFLSILHATENERITIVYLSEGSL
jgi:RNAse (barnase) inhibitor barstar